MSPPRRVCLLLPLVAAACAESTRRARELDFMQEICAGPVPQQARIALTDLSPPAGKPVQRKTVIRARLQYSVPGKWAGECRLAAQFETTQPGGRFLSLWQAHVVQPPLLRGTETLEVALAPHFDDPNLAKPVRLRFVVQYLRGGAIVAETPLVTYGPGEVSPGEPSLTVRSLDPAPDEAFTPDTVVAALVAYFIPDAARNKYEIRTEVAGVRPGQTIMPFSKGARAPLTGASGRVVLQLGLAELLQLGETRRPLEINFVAGRVEDKMFHRLIETPVASYDFCKVIGTPK